MKYNQKQRKDQRIQQITDTTLIVGCDMAKNIHVARAIDNREIELGNRCKFTNDRQGFLLFLSWIRQLQAKYKKDKIIVGIEPTGHYWFPLERFLKEENIQLVLVNPSHVKRTKEFDDNSPTKNDTKDAKVIAELVKNGKYNYHICPEQEFADLRILMNQRERINISLTRVKNQIHQWLGRFFPEYSEVFKDWEGKASLIVLHSFPLPCEIVEQGPLGVLIQWRKTIQRGIGIKRATQLVEAASKTIGLQDALISARLELKLLLEQYDLLQGQNDTILTEVYQLIDKIPYAAFLLTLSGISKILVAGFLAETGDLYRYSDGQQIIRLAGLHLKENSSGTHKGKTKITKRGRPQLRSLLFRSVLVLVRNNPEFRALHHYYTTRSQNPLKKKQSIIALCGKLIRVLYTLGTKQITYYPEAIVGPYMQKMVKAS